MKFSNEPTLWRPSVVAPSEENCEDAVEWIKTFQAYGNACTVEPLQVSLITGYRNYIVIQELIVITFKGLTLAMKVSFPYTSSKFVHV